MMSEPLVMTCDIGTQSTRALLVDKHGNIVDMHQIKYAEPYISVKPGWAEQKTDFITHILRSFKSAVPEKCG